MLFLRAGGKSADTYMGIGVKTGRTRQWALFITRARLLFYLVFRTRSIRFRNIYHLQMALVV